MGSLLHHHYSLREAFGRKGACLTGHDWWEADIYNHFSAIFMVIGWVEMPWFRPATKM